MTHELQFNSPDRGVVTIDIEKLTGSNYFEFTFNSSTYRKLIILSQELVNRQLKKTGFLSTTLR